MNYRRIYESLISRGKDRNLQSGYETHHIIPRCMGGSDDLDNLVRLTPEEHYTAHQLLVKIYPENHKLAKAAGMMIPSRPSNKMYGWLRRRFAAAQSVDQSGSGNSQYGTRWIHNPCTKENKKIKGDLPAGWKYGKYKEPKVQVTKCKEPKVQVVSKKWTQCQESKKIYTEYYEIYKRVGFEEFVTLTNYKFTKQNLVQMFAKHVEGFIPQNGKKR